MRPSEDVVAVESGESARVRRRPLGVVVITAGLVLVVAGLVLYIGLGFAGHALPTTYLPIIGEVNALVDVKHAPLPVVEIVAAVWAVVLLTLAVGFWLKRRWAWIGVMFAAAASLTINVAATFVGTPNHATMALAIVAVFYLNQTDVQQLFGGR